MSNVYCKVKGGGVPYKKVVFYTVVINSWRLLLSFWASETTSFSHMNRIGRILKHCLPFLLTPLRGNSNDYDFAFLNKMTVCDPISRSLIRRYVFVPSFMPGRSHVVWTQVYCRCETSSKEKVFHSYFGNVRCPQYYWRTCNRFSRTVTRVASTSCLHNEVRWRVWYPLINPQILFLFKSFFYRYCCFNKNTKN